MRESTRTVWIERHGTLIEVHTRFGVQTIDAMELSHLLQEATAALIGLFWTERQNHPK